MNKKKTILSLMAMVFVMGLTSCGGGGSIQSNEADPERTFTYFIPKEDGTGVGGSYKSYDQNPSILYLTKDPFTYKTATKQNGSYVQGEEVTKNVALRFTSSTTGQEQNGFITNLNSGVDVLDMNYAPETAQTMFENGKLMDLTYWVENYMPNYLEVTKKFGIDHLVATRDENGNKRYLQIYSIYENVNWQYYGYQYRRDWLLEYGKTFDTSSGAIGTQTFKQSNPDWGWNVEGDEKKWIDGIKFPSWYGFQYTSDGAELGMGKFTYNQELYDYIHGQNQKGLVTFDRKVKKDAFYLYKAYWSKEPFVHLCGARYIDRVETPTNIKVYSNLKEVELYVDDGFVAKLSGDKIFNFKIEINGRHRVRVVAGNCSDEIEIRKVQSPNPEYQLLNSEVTNWFEREEVSKHYFTIADSIGDIAKSPEGKKVLLDFIKENAKRVTGPLSDKAAESMLKMMSSMSFQKILKRSAGTISNEEIENISKELNKIKK